MEVVLFFSWACGEGHGQGRLKRTRTVKIEKTF